MPTPELALPHLIHSPPKEAAMSKMTRTKVRVAVALGALIASVGVTAAACVGSPPSGFSQPNAQSTVSHIGR